MAGPPAPASPLPTRRSVRLVRLRGGDHQPPSPPPAASAAPPSGMAPRRSVRVQTRARVRGLPSAAPSPATTRRRSPAAPPRQSVEAYAEEWAKEKAASGAPEEECVLPFLQNGAPRKVECLICSKSILPDERMQCSVQDCEVTLHKACFQKRDGFCPRHICCYCKRIWHTVQHTIPACPECSPQQNRMADSVDLSKTMICWSIWPSTNCKCQRCLHDRGVPHPINWSGKGHSPIINASNMYGENYWLLNRVFLKSCTFQIFNNLVPAVCFIKDAGPADNIEEAFRRLPLPCTDQEFNTDPIKKEELENGTEPPPYVHLKHNVYLFKNKGDSDAIEGGCTDCDPALTCKISCSCRSALISCSRACHCSDKCTNKPFRREKRIEIVKTQDCGWGAIALETIEKDDFVIEFVGEVIDDVTCEERLENMKQRGDKNFYMCKVHKDFVIDATFRGNDCRFFNHSCKPNCQLEKWQVNGKTRLGVFASLAIEVGEPLTYNYRFKQHFGPRIECFCGAPNCQGNL